jgi:hypothetical protein
LDLALDALERRRVDIDHADALAVGVLANELRPGVAAQASATLKGS